MSFLSSHRFSHGGKFVALASDVAEPTSRLQTVEDVTLLNSVAVIKCVTTSSAVIESVTKNIASKFDLIVW